MAVYAILFQNAAMSAACFGLLWLVSVRLRDVSYIDSWWALGIVLLAVATHFQTGDRSAHGLLLLVLSSVWGLRLGIYLFWRWRSQGPDRRYQRLIARIKGERKWSFEKIAFGRVFALQAALQFVVALPVQLGQMNDGADILGPYALAGTALSAFGILFESIADLQLVLFRRRPGSDARVLDSGLWRFTRHPNYFGDACVWWGLFLIAIETPVGFWSIPGPILLTALLTRWSGVPLVEEPMRRKRPDYESYMRRTSRFLPWLPKGRA